MAENSLYRVATPLVKRFEPQVRVLDEVADKQLSHLETRFPTVKKPVNEIWNDSVNAVRDPLVHRYEAVRDRIHAGKQSSLDYAQRAIDMADHYVDTYLPSDESEQEMSTMVDETEPEKPLTASTGTVLRKTHRRIRRRGQRKVAEAQQAVQNALTKAIASVGLLETLQKAQAGVADLNEEFWERLENLKEDSVRDVQEDMESSDSSSQHSFDSSNSPAVEIVVVRVAARCVHATSNVLSVLGDMLYSRLDEEKQHRWDTANHALHEFYARLRESPQTLSSSYLQHMRDLLQSLNKAVTAGLHCAAQKVHMARPLAASS